MRHPWRGLPLLLAVSPGVASAGPHGPTAAIGAVFAPAETTAVGTGEKVQEGPLMGPMVQVGYQTGDWVNHQFMAQFSMSSGSVSYDNAILDSNARLRTAGIGYELTLNIFGKAGKAGFTPILGAGVLVGWCQADVSSHSDDAKVEAALENAGVADETAGGPYPEFHAVAGLRYRLGDHLGLRAEAGYSTYGGFYGTWEPKLGLDWSFGSPTQG